MSDFKETKRVFTKENMKPLKNLQYAKVKMSIGLNIKNA